MNTKNANIEGFVNADGSVTPARSEEEKKAKIEKEKAALDAKLASGEIGAIEYNKRLFELRVPEEFKPKPHKKIRIASFIALICVIGVASVPAAIYLNWRFYFQNTLTMKGVPTHIGASPSSIDKDPIQVNLEGHTESGEYKGKPIQITYKAYYDITGIVTSVRDYWGFDAYDTLVPRDVCMIWGDLAAQYPNPGMNFAQGKRNCHASFSSDIHIDSSDITVRSGAYGSKHYNVSLMSNNHLIPSTAEVRNKIFSFGVGDEVRIVGYLARVSYDGFVLDSSMTREDAMYDHATGTCEVIYVTKAEVIKKPN